MQGQAESHFIKLRLPAADQGQVSFKAVHRAEESETAKQAICRSTNAEAPDFLVLGSHGRRGSKPNVLGSCTDASVRRVYASTVIVKDTSNIRARADAKTFLIMHKGDAGSNSAIRLVGHIMRSTDTMVVVHCSTEASRTSKNPEQRPGEVMKRIVNEVKDAGVNAQLHLCQARPGEPVSEVILHIANGAGEGKVQVDCDFLVLGVDCMDAFFEAKELGCISNDGIEDDALVCGSVTDSVIKQCRPSVIIVKPDSRLKDAKGKNIW